MLMFPNIVLTFIVQESSSAVEEVEECCLQAFTSLVVKLSEASFRPMFLKVPTELKDEASPVLISLMKLV